MPTNTANYVPCFLRVERLKGNSLAVVVRQTGNYNEKAC